MIHNAIAKWLTKLLAKVCGGAISELPNDIDGSDKRLYVAMGIPGAVKKRAHDVVIVDGATESGRKEPTHQPQKV